MDIRQYLDSTYLKTPEQAGLSEQENRKVVERVVKEAIAEKFKLVMVRPDMVKFAAGLVHAAPSALLIGTVIDFPNGTADIESKLAEARQAIGDGADDLDFVCNYNAFINGNNTQVREEVIRCTELGIQHRKTVKWIIEVAALNPGQIIRLSALIKNCIVSHFKEEVYESVYVKSSTGFFKTENNLPNGATIETIKMMLENVNPLQVKAAGGVRTYEDAVEMIRLGVKRIGTSSAKAIASGNEISGTY